MNRFGNLAADVAAPFKIEIIDPTTDEVIKDKAGKVAFISIWSVDSDRARAFDKSKRKDLQLRVMRSRTGKVEQDDQLETNIAKCAALTDSWYLVDPVTLEQIDVPCTPENAADLYSEVGMAWLFLQPWVGANDTANFMQKRPKGSSASPSGPSDSTASAKTEPQKKST